MAKQKLLKPPITPISSIKHEKDTRVNIPSEELRDFVTEEEKAPRVVLYSRDPSLDPQLVWCGRMNSCAEDVMFEGDDSGRGAVYY